jgi:hypothetical protein
MKKNISIRTIEPKSTKNQLKTKKPSILETKDIIAHVRVLVVAVLMVVVVILRRVRMLYVLAVNVLHGQVLVQPELPPSKLQEH